MSAPLQRPRIVNAAFWCWLAAAVLLAALGLLLALNKAHIPVFLRGAAALFVVAGLALGYLAGRTRNGSTRYRRAAVALALAVVLLLALFILVGGGGILWVLPMILTLAGAILVTRPSAQEWFPSEDKP
jgi:peptidoglycan/LPS O-acetylase OafA/YrhL